MVFGFSFFVTCCVKDPKDAGTEAMDDDLDAAPFQEKQVRSPSKGKHHKKGGHHHSPRSRGDARPLVFSPRMPRDRQETFVIEEELFEVTISLPDGRKIRTKSKQTDKVMTLKVALHQQTGIPFDLLLPMSLRAWNYGMLDELQLNAYGIPWNGTDVVLDENILGRPRVFV